MINNVCDAIDLAKRLARQTGQIAVVSRYRGLWTVSSVDDDLDDADRMFINPSGRMSSKRCRTGPLVSEGGCARHLTGPRNRMRAHGPENGF